MTPEPDPDDFTRLTADLTDPAGVALPYTERMAAAAARLDRVCRLPEARRTMHGPFLWHIHQLALGLKLGVRHHQHPEGPPHSEDEPCLPLQIADTLLGNPLIERGHE